MMTLGRLRAIESYNHRADPMNPQAPITASLLHKHGCELIAEVKRLREVLEKVATPMGKLPIELCEMARAALREPDRGPPDIVCRRGTLEEEEFKWEGSDGT